MKLALVGAFLALAQAHMPGTVLINDNNAMYGFPEGETEAYGFYGWPRPFLRQIDRAHYMGPGGLGPDQTHYAGTGGFEARHGAVGGEVATPPNYMQQNGDHDMMYARLDNNMANRAVADVLIIPDGETSQRIKFHFDATYPLYAAKNSAARFEFWNGTCEAPTEQIVVTASNSFLTKIAQPVKIEFNKRDSETRASGDYTLDASFGDIEGLNVVMRNITAGIEGDELSCGPLTYPTMGLPRNFRFRRSARIWWPWHKYGRHINWFDDDPSDTDGTDDQLRTSDDDMAHTVPGEDDNPLDGADDDGSDTYNFRRRRRYGDLPDYVYMPKRDYGFYGFGVSEAAMLLAILVILQNIGMFGGSEY